MNNNDEIPRNAIYLILILWIISVFIIINSIFTISSFYPIDVFHMLIAFLGINILFGFIINYLCGLLVKYRSVKVNYTRKIGHFSIFFLPYFLNLFFTFPSYIDTIIPSLASGVYVLFFVIYFRPIRERVFFLKTGFFTFDRPEDRPHTFFWLSTQLYAGLLISFFTSSYLRTTTMAGLWVIIVLISGIGDGLAEPVGIRFGKHKYNVKGIFSKQKYVRSIEGSACVFITSILSILAFYSGFTSLQFIIALILIPICMTLAEAFSPHTWDNPFLFLIGGFLLFGISLL